MGLLDEAIREHLELKRRGGADPSAVERDEQEVLASPSPQGERYGLEDGDGELEHDDEAYYEVEDLPAREDRGELRLAEEDPRPAPTFADLADAGQQDTAELDMQAAMKAEPGPVAGPAPYAAPSGGGWTKPYAGRQDEEPLEWELPGDREREPPPQNIPGQERLSFE